jgi:hypothetical protein
MGFTFYLHTLLWLARLNIVLKQAKIRSTLYPIHCSE